MTEDTTTEGEVIVDEGNIPIDTMPKQVIVDFTAQFTEGTESLMTPFSPIVEGEVLSYSWDFGDGNTSTDQSPTHSYVTMGLYTVSLSVVMKDESTGSTSKDKYIIVHMGKSDRSCPIKSWDDEVDGVSYHHTIYKAINEYGGEAYFQVDEEYTKPVVEEPTPVQNPLDQIVLDNSALSSKVDDLTTSINAIKEALGIVTKEVDV